MAGINVINKIKQELSVKSDTELISIKIEGGDKLHRDNDLYNKHLVATQLLHERQLERAENNHIELLAEIRKPHWSVTPGFLVGIIAMVAACIAAYYSYLAFAQPHQVGTASVQSEKRARDETNTSYSLLPQLHSLPASQQQTSKK